MLLARAAAAAMRLLLSRAAPITSQSCCTQPPPRAMTSLNACWTTTQQLSLNLTRPQQRNISVASFSSSSSSSPSKTSKLEPPDVRELAKMAQLEVTEEEVADWEPKIRKIVSWFDQLQAVDLEAEEEKQQQAEEQGGGGVKKSATTSEEEFLLRADEVPQFGGDPADALREAPEKEGEFLKVPRIM